MSLLEESAECCARSRQIIAAVRAATRKRESDLVQLWRLMLEFREVNDTAADSVKHSTPHHEEVLPTEAGVHDC